MAKLRKPTSGVPADIARDPVGEFLMGLVTIFQTQPEGDDALAGQIEKLLRKRPAPARDLALLPGEQVRQLLEQAWALGDLRAVPLAIDVLRLSPWTPDAWTLLATAFTEEAQLTVIFSSLAVLAAERSLKPGAVEQFRGRVWDSPEIQAYLEATQNLALAFIRLDRLPEAYRRLDELLLLDPADHLGARHALLGVTLRVHDLDYAEHLVETFPEEALPSWLYLKALTEFARWGDTEIGRRLLQEAHQAAPAAAKFLVTAGLSPRAGDAASGLSEDEVGSVTADVVRDAFRAHNGSINWVQRTLGIRPSLVPFRRPGNKPAGRKRR
jgi:hypothetical protein